MAGGWAKDGAVQDQIDANVADAVAIARGNIPQGETSLERCEECDREIPTARQLAIKGVRLCIACQSLSEKQSHPSTLNRRASKDSQLK